MKESRRTESGGSPLLVREEGALCLRAGDRVLCPDFRHLLPRVRPDRLGRELLVRAARGRRDTAAGMTAVDATAGLGEDAFLLAAAGFQVSLFEADPVIAALLADALERAERDEALCGIVSRMHLAGGDSTEGMRKLSFRPDVVFLDPMFPERSKSGLVKKKFQLLQLLEAPCADGGELLAAAEASRAGKIVIKRPAKGPYLGGREPSYSIGGKTVRYDCLVLQGGGRG